jgi:hypothetical protein
MSDYAYEPTQNKVRHPIGGLGPYGLLEPFQIGPMVGSILAVGVDEHVDVEKDHRDSSMRLRSAALSSRSTPG